VKLEGNKEAQQLLQTTVTSIQNWLLPYPTHCNNKSSEQNISYQPCTVYQFLCERQSPSLVMCFSDLEPQGGADHMHDHTHSHSDTCAKKVFGIYSTQKSHTDNHTEMGMGI